MYFLPRALGSECGHRPACLAIASVTASLPIGQKKGEFLRVLRDYAVNKEPDFLLTNHFEIIE